MKYFVIFFIVFVAFAVFPIENIFAEEEILILVENDVRKVYYTGDNIVSAFHDPEFASVIFETDYNAKLEIKAPQVYKNGPGLFVLRNGEEISPETRTDDCFYYTTIETQVPETIEIIFAFWPEYPETKKGCETFTVSPLKQHQLGISIDEIQCKESLILVTKYDGSPACVTYQTGDTLVKRGWATCDDGISHGRGHPCGPRSSGIVSFDKESYKIESEDEHKIFCESHEGKWSDEFHNCVGGSIEVSCDVVGASELTPPNVFGKIITEEGICVSHELFCTSMGGNSACMSDVQKGHGRDICIAVCEFE